MRNSHHGTERCTFRLLDHSLSTVDDRPVPMGSLANSEFHAQRHRVSAKEVAADSELQHNSATMGFEGRAIQNWKPETGRTRATAGSSPSPFPAALLGALIMKTFHGAVCRDNHPHQNEVVERCVYQS